MLSYYTHNSTEERSKNTKCLNTKINCGFDWEIILLFKRNMKIWLYFLLFLANVSESYIWKETAVLRIQIWEMLRFLNFCTFWPWNFLNHSLSIIFCHDFFELSSLPFKHKKFSIKHNIRLKIKYGKISTKRFDSWTTGRMHRV